MSSRVYSRLAVFLRMQDLLLEGARRIRAGSSVIGMAGERFALMKNHQGAGSGDEDREGGHDDGEKGFLHRR